jgi:hypothetical protein
MEGMVVARVDHGRGQRSDASIHERDSWDPSGNVAFYISIS